MKEKNRNNKGQFVNKYTFNDKFFNKIDSHESAYLLGFICGDGNIKNNVFTIAQSGEVEKEILLWFKDKINSNHFLYKRKPKKSTHRISYVLSITSKKLVESLKNLGVSENKKYKLQYPNIINEDYFKSFLRGYFDGDGCVGVYYEKKKKNNKTYKSKYLKLSFYGTKEFISACNNKIPSEIKGRIRNVGSHSEIIWTNKKARNFGEWLFSNKKLFQSVKYNKYWDYIDKFRNTPNVFDRLSKPVIQKDIHGKLIKEYKSIAEVKRQLNISISTCLSGKTRTAGGYIWEYKM